MDMATNKFFNAKSLVFIWLLSTASSQRNKKRLEFVHIPKNSGTSITIAGAKAGISWGRCHYLSTSHCENVTADLEWTGGCPWHVRPHQLEPHPYGGADLFAVARNPYDRIISLYYYQNREKDMKESNDLDRLNNIVKKINPEMHTYWPVSSYQFDKNGRKVIDHILHFENLETEFNALMKEYDLNVTLGVKHNLRKNGSKFKKEDLSREALDFINEHYRQDFISYGYDFL